MRPARPFQQGDTLVNKAGVYISRPFTDYAAEDYALVVGANLTGFFWLTSAGHHQDAPLAWHDGLAYRRAARKFSGGPDGRRVSRRVG